jgi:hypothetical protein
MPPSVTALHHQSLFASSLAWSSSATCSTSKTMGSLLFLLMLFLFKAAEACCVTVLAELLTG